MARIMLCDDAMFLRTTLQRIVEAAGHTVVGQAEDGKEAIEVYKHCKPDIVLMDITMPEMNGLEATRQIVAHDKNAKIIMVSAMGQQDMVFEAIASGAKDFVIKPFQPDFVVNCIAKYVK